MEFHYGIILRNHLYEADPGDARDVPGAPLGPRGPPGHAPGSHVAAPGIPEHAPGTVWGRP